MIRPSESEQIQISDQLQSQTATRKMSRELGTRSFKARTIGHTFSNGWKIPSPLPSKVVIASTNLSPRTHLLDQPDQRVMVIRRE